MKKFIFLLFATLFTFSLVALAQTAPAAPVPPSGDELSAFLSSLLSLKGAGAMVIVGTVVQGLLLFFRSSLAKFAGIYQLFIVSGLTLVGMVIMDLATGKGFVAILSDTSLLAAVQVFIHQIYNQTQKLPADQAATAAAAAPVSPSV
jgi:hypothetical protein